MRKYCSFSKLKISSLLFSLEILLIDILFNICHKFVWRVINLKVDRNFFQISFLTLPASLYTYVQSLYRHNFPWMHIFMRNCRLRNIIGKEYRICYLRLYCVLIESDIFFKMMVLEYWIGIKRKCKFLMLLHFFYKSTSVVIENIAN